MMQSSSNSSSTNFFTTNFLPLTNINHKPSITTLFTIPKEKIQHSSSYDDHGFHGDLGYNNSIHVSNFPRTTLFRNDLENLGDGISPILAENEVFIDENDVVQQGTKNNITNKNNEDKVEVAFARNEVFNFSLFDLYNPLQELYSSRITSCCCDVRLSDLRRYTSFLETRFWYIDQPKHIECDFIPIVNDNSLTKSFMCISNSTDNVKGWFFDNNHDIENVIQYHHMENSIKRRKNNKPTRLSIPYSAITKQDYIQSDSKDIYVRHNVGHDSNPILTRKNGRDEKVLIVRVIGLDYRAHFSPSLFLDLFGKNHHSSCSLLVKDEEDKLLHSNAIPATGKEVIDGVINVKLQIKLEGLHFTRIITKIDSKLKKMKDLDYQVKFILMPNDVNFGLGGKRDYAWSSLLGETILISNESVQKLKDQRNLGLCHDWNVVVCIVLLLGFCFFKCAVVCHHMEKLTHETKTPIDSGSVDEQVVDFWKKETFIIEYSRKKIILEASTEKLTTFLIENGFPSQIDIRAELISFLQSQEIEYLGLSKNRFFYLSCDSFYDKKDQCIRLLGVPIFKVKCNRKFLNVCCKIMRFDTSNECDKAILKDIKRHIQQVKKKEVNLTFEKDFEAW